MLIIRIRARVKDSVICFFVFFVFSPSPWKLQLVEISIVIFQIQQVETCLPPCFKTKSDRYGSQQRYSAKDHCSSTAVPCSFSTTQSPSSPRRRAWTKRQRCRKKRTYGGGRSEATAGPGREGDRHHRLHEPVGCCQSLGQAGLDELSAARILVKLPLKNQLLQSKLHHDPQSFSLVSV